MRPATLFDVFPRRGVSASVFLVFAFSGCGAGESGGSSTGPDNDRANRVEQRRVARTLKTYVAARPGDERTVCSLQTRRRRQGDSVKVCAAAFKRLGYLRTRNPAIENANYKITIRGSSAEATAPNVGQFGLKKVGGRWKVDSP